MCQFPGIRDQLIISFLQNAHQLPYAQGRIGPQNQYLGWVAGDPLHLNLPDDFHRFLLFVLASGWSHTGPWENANYFIVDILENQYGRGLLNRNEIQYWQNGDNINWEIQNRVDAANIIYQEVGADLFRNRLSFRRDFYFSANLIACNWENICYILEACANNNNYIPFINYMRGMVGLAGPGRSMLIKIPLILRELRCQGVYDNIPGELCCVPDSRVINNAKKVLIDNGIVDCSPFLFARRGDPVNWLVRQSSSIYMCFGDLYDLPLFAYNDMPLDHP